MLDWENCPSLGDFSKRLRERTGTDIFVQLFAFTLEIEENLERETGSP